jgi:hypothetical protein
LVARIWADRIPANMAEFRDRMLLDFGTGKISVMIDFLNAREGQLYPLKRIECVWRLRKMNYVFK